MIRPPGSVEEEPDGLWHSTLMDCLDFKKAEN